MFDFSEIIDTFSVTNLLAGITALAAVMYLPDAVRWGYTKIMGWFSEDEEYHQGDDADEDEERLEEDDLWEGSTFECDRCGREEPGEVHIFDGDVLCGGCAAVMEGDV